MNGNEEKTNIKVKFYLKMLYIIYLFFSLFFQNFGIAWTSKGIINNQVSILIDEA